MRGIWIYRQAPDLQNKWAVEWPHGFRAVPTLADAYALALDLQSAQYKSQIIRVQHRSTSTLTLITNEEDMVLFMLTNDYD